MVSQFFLQRTTAEIFIVQYSNNRRFDSNWDSTMQQSNNEVFQRPEVTRILHGRCYRSGSCSPPRQLVQCCSNIGPVCPFLFSSSRRFTYRGVPGPLETSIHLHISLTSPFQPSRRGIAGYHPGIGFDVGSESRFTVHHFTQAPSPPPLRVCMHISRTQFRAFRNFPGHSDVLLLTVSWSRPSSLTDFYSP